MVTQTQNHLTHTLRLSLKIPAGAGLSTGFMCAEREQQRPRRASALTLMMSAHVSSTNFPHSEPTLQKLLAILLNFKPSDSLNVLPDLDT